MASIALFSIGHSNLPAARFLALLHAAGVNAIADVRSAPVLRFCPWFSRGNLESLLARNGLHYSFHGEALGGRPRDGALFRDGIADYEAMARQPEFAAGLHRLCGEAAQWRLCMLCTEREPLDCHRCLLVARVLATRDVAVGHILFDGSIEPQAMTQRRLLELASDNEDLFLTGQDERLAAAYRRRGHAVAYRAKGARPIREENNR